MTFIVAAIANAVFAAVAATGISVVAAAWISLAIAYTAILYPLYAYNRQQAKKAAAAMNSLNGRAMTVRDPSSSRVLVYGRARVGGVIVYASTSGTGNKYLNLVVAHAGHECQAIERFFLDSDEVFVDGSGVVTSAVDQQGNSTSKYNSKVRVKTHLGSASQTYDTDLAAEMGAEWNSNCRLQGICYTYWRLEYDQNVFSGMPNVSVVLKGKKVYDPRSSTTAWSENPALCLRDYLTDEEYGLAATSSEIDDTACIAAANACDETVTLADSSTQARYTCNGVIDSATQAGSVIGQLLGSMAGISPWLGGKFVMKAGAYTAPVKTFTLDDARGAIITQTRDSRRDAFNGVKGVFVGVDNNYQPGDFPPVKNDTYMSEDDGVRIWHEISLPFTDTSAMAQRLAKIELERSRQDISVTFPCKLTALNVSVGDNVALTIARYGWSGKVFEVTNWQFAVYDSGEGKSLGIDMTLRETASGVWDWSSGEETAFDLAANSSLYVPTSVSSPSGLSLTTSNFQQSDGAITPRLKVEWTAATDRFVVSGGRVRIEYKKSADSDWIHWNDAPGGSALEYITDALAGVGYDVRIAFQNVQGKVSGYTSASITVSADSTAPSAPTGLSALSTTGSITLTWNRNSETDVAFYRIYRNTSNDPSGASQVSGGEIAGRVFTDYNAGTGTKYYWITAVDRTNNESTKSSGTSGTANPATGNKIANVFKRASSIPSTPSGNFVPSGWSDTPPAADGNPLWYSVAEVSSTGVLVGSWTTPIRLDGANGSNGADGSNGYSNAIVYIYQRSASGAPTLPSATTTYTFSTGALTGLNNGWSQTIPAGTDPLYVSAATASSTGSTDTIASGEWSGAVVLAANGSNGSNGSNGTNGTDGLNSASVFIYQRSASGAPTLPSATTTYTFATGALTGLNNGWQQGVPSGTNPLYVSQATAVSTGSTDTITSGEWSSALVLAQNGADGDSVEVEYSINGSTSWHSTFTTGDFYMRVRVGGGSWNGPIKISGEIEDGEITTAKLAYGSVSEVSAVQESSVTGITNGSWTQIADIAVNADEGQDVVLQAGFAYADEGAAFTTDFDVRILRNGTTDLISTGQSVRTGNTDLIFLGVVDPDLPSGGATSYTLEIKPLGGGGTATPSARDPFLAATILKDRLN